MTRPLHPRRQRRALLKREHLVQSASGWTTQSWTVYIGGVYEMHGDGSVTKYYAGQGRTVAIRQVSASGGAGALFFPIPDHLGSTRALLDYSRLRCRGVMRANDIVADVLAPLALTTTAESR